MNKRDSFFNIIREYIKSFTQKKIEVKNIIDNNNEFDEYFQEVLKLGNYDMAFDMIKNGYEINKKSQEMIDNLIILSFNFINKAFNFTKIKPEYDFQIIGQTHLTTLLKVLPVTSSVYKHYRINDSVLKSKPSFANAEMELLYKEYSFTLLFDDFEKKDIYRPINFEILARATKGMDNNKFNEMVDKTVLSRNLNPYIFNYFLEKELNPQTYLKKPLLTAYEVLLDLIDVDSDNHIEVVKKIENYQKSYNQEFDLEILQKEAKDVVHREYHSLVIIKLIDSAFEALKNNDTAKDMVEFILMDKKIDKKLKKDSYEGFRNPISLTDFKKNLLTYLIIFKSDEVAPYLCKDIIKKIKDCELNVNPLILEKISDIIFDKKNLKSTSIIQRLKNHNEQIKIMSAFENNDNESLELLLDSYNVLFLKDTLENIRSTVIDLQFSNLDIETKVYVKELIKKIYSVLDDYQELDNVLSNVNERKQDLLENPILQILNELNQVNIKIQNENLNSLKKEIPKSIKRI